ncbi:HNH endonuclease family protein [soil metagenome]
MRRLAPYVLLCVIVGYGVWTLRGDDDGDQTDQPPVESIDPGKLITLSSALARLRVEPEDHTQYRRSYFGDGWIDVDGDCQRTRAEVLIRDSSVKPRISRSGCTVVGGRWNSYYDNRTTTDPFALQIDHLIPLAEAWDSGAYQWSAARRVAFANDLGDARALVPTTNAVNDDKEADDPPGFIPSKNVCRYVQAWIAVKLRWDLSADAREHRALASLVADCPDSAMNVKVVP